MREGEIDQRYACALERDLLARKHRTLDVFDLRRLKLRQKNQQTVGLQFLGWEKFPGVRTAARAEPGLSARDQNARIKQAVLQCREVQHAYKNR